MRKLIRSAVVLAAAGGLGMTGLLAPSQAATGQPLPVASAGTLVGWGSTPGATVPTSLDGVEIVDVDASTTGWSAAVKPDGSVVAWGTGRPATSGLSNVAAIDVYGSGLVALKKDGSVAGAGDSTQGLEDAPALTGATDIAVNMMAGAAVAGGTVHEWGTALANPMFATLLPPTTLKQVTQVAGGLSDFTAVESDGTVVNWGVFSTTPVPSAVQGHVEALAGGQVSGMTGSVYAAVLDDGSVQAWNGSGEITTPAELAGKKVVDVDVNGSITALTADGQIFSWGTTQTLGAFPATAAGVPTAVSAGMNQDNTSFAYAIVTPFKAVGTPAITGTAQVGRTLTAAAASFSLTPDRVVTQWLADGAAIAGATGDTLGLTAAQVGKRISVRQTATLAGQQDVTTVSPATAAVAKTASTTKVGKAQVKNGKAVVKVTVTTAAGVSPAGQAKVVVKRGAKKVAKKTVQVNAHGVARLKLKKLTPGKYKVKAHYTGSASVAGSKDRGTFKIRR